MPSAQMRLSWVQRLVPPFFGAHLEAYVETLPTINALRLCRTFGKGDKAYVARLPKEIIEMVRDIIFADKCEVLEGVWNKAGVCFLTACRPGDHYSPEEQALLYHEHKHMFSENLSKINDRTAEMAPSSLSPQEVAALRVILYRLADDLDEPDYGDFDEAMPGIPGWGKRHRHECEKWTMLTGKHGEDDHGIFTTHEELFRQHFGLDIWTSHSVKPGMWQGEIKLMTHMYVTLPSQDASFTWDHRLEGFESTTRLPTENTLTLNIAPPPQPSSKSLARFARALKILDLEPLSLATQPQLQLGDVTSTESEDGSDQHGGEGSPSDVDSKPEFTGPALKLLVVSRDNSAAEQVG